MFYDAVRNDHGLENDPFKALVAPRPIGWISTLSEAGVANLAPYSYFNAMSQDPHYVVFGSGPRKDSLRNAEAAGEFAVNLATFDLREPMEIWLEGRGRVLAPVTLVEQVGDYEIARYRLN